MYGVCIRLYEVILSAFQCYFFAFHDKRFPFSTKHVML